MLTKEQQDFIINNYKGKSHRKMAELLNAKFGLVCFADMNKKNFEKDNLVLVSRSELATMNKKNKFSEFPDITKTELNLLRFERKIRGFDK